MASFIELSVNGVSVFVNMDRVRSMKKHHNNANATVIDFDNGPTIIVDMPADDIFGRVAAMK